VTAKDRAQELFQKLQANWLALSREQLVHTIEEFVKAEIEQERQACAQIADDCCTQAEGERMELRGDLSTEASGKVYAATLIAARIRARGKGDD
jgi:hypothetical protein